MPRPGMLLETGKTESQDLDEAVALSLAAAEADVWASSPPPAPPQSGVSFAHMAKMGFAASGEGAPPLAAASSVVVVRCYFASYFLHCLAALKNMSCSSIMEGCCTCHGSQAVVGSCLDAAMSNLLALQSAGP